MEEPKSTGVRVVRGVVSASRSSCIPVAFCLRQPCYLRRVDASVDDFYIDEGC